MALRGAWPPACCLLSAFPFCPLRALGLGLRGGWREGGLGSGGLLALSSKETQEVESEVGVRFPLGCGCSQNGQLDWYS